MRKIFLFLLIIMFGLSSLAHSEVTTLIGEGTYILKNNETLEHAKNEAVRYALNGISMQAAAAIRGQYYSQNNQLTDDILELVTSSVMQINDKSFDLNFMPDDTIEVVATVKATIDIDKAKEMSQKLLNDKSSSSNNETIQASQDNMLPVNWWESEILTATGYGVPPKGESNLNLAKHRARQAAMLDGYRRLAEQAVGIRITADKNIVKGEINAVLSGVKPISEIYDDYGNCTVVLQVPIYGVENSIAKAAFKPVQKEKFPEPSELSASTGNYTGLIIDCGDMELNPVLSPNICNSENQSIYSYNNLDYDQVISNGMVSYFKNDEKVQNKIRLLKAANIENKFVQVGSNILILSSSVENNNLSRAGSNPLVIKAKNLRADSSCPVISNSDSNKILAENQASHFLDNGNVVFMSNRIRGFRM